MRLLFGKILSGEIRTPGSFSLKAVRTLGMINKTTAEEFERLCNVSMVIGNQARVISYSGSAGQNSLKDHGLGFIVLSDLNENDLIYGDFNTKTDCKILVESRIPFEYASQTVWLEKIDERKIDGLSKVRGIVFSKIGTELRQIVSLRADSNYTLKLIKYFQDRGCELIKAVTKREDGSLFGKPYRDLG
jgi:hypothetical protein